MVKVDHDLKEEGEEVKAFKTNISTIQQRTSHLVQFMTYCDPNFTPR